MTGVQTCALPIFQKDSYRKIEDKIIYNSTRLGKVQDALDISKSEENNIVLKKELERFQRERDKLKEQKIQIKNKKVSNSVITQYQELRKKIDSIHRNINSKSKILEQNDTSFQSIISALTKALISKKQPI